MRYSYTDEFLRDLKKLKKKLPSLEGDLENFKKNYPFVILGENKRFIVLTETKTIKIIKTRLMVRSLKGSNKTRLIFAFKISGNEVEFIEIYMKNSKGREDSERIKRYLQK